MEEHSGKILVNLLGKLNDFHLFFIGWFAMVAFFVVGMVNFRKQRDRRNFRDVPYKMKDLTPPGKAVVPKGETSPANLRATGTGVTKNGNGD